MRRVGLLGGTFDPFHIGHLDVGLAADRFLGLSELILIVSNVPPHRPQAVASSHHRFAMVALAIAGRPHWRASDLELTSGGTSFTTDTLRRFHDAGCKPTELFFVLGADAFADIESWRHYPGILEQAHFAVVSRPGAPVGSLAARLPSLTGRMTAAAPGNARDATSIFLIDAATADVSATAIRGRVASREPIAGMVPAAVQQHIEQHGLYASSSETSGDLTGGITSQRTSAAGRLHGQDR
jgi:nicotinate-nucleotide adenylyltransferase